MKYKEDITFVITIDKFFMEAIVPRKNWILSFGYKVIEDVIEGTTQVLLKIPMDDTQERFGTIVKKSLKVHMEHTKKTREKNVKKVIWESMKKVNVTKEEIIEFRHSRRLVGSSKTSTKEKNPKGIPPTGSPKEKQKDAKRKTIEVESEEEEQENYRIHVWKSKDKKPLEANRSFESITQREILKVVGDLYNEASNEDKYSIVKAFILYCSKLDAVLKDFKKDIPKDLWT